MGLDVLASTSTATIVSVDADGQHVQLDSRLADVCEGSYTVQGAPAQLFNLDGSTCSLHTDFLLRPGHQVQHQCVLASTSAIHHALHQHWLTRWGRPPDLAPEPWQKVATFLEAYLPSRPLQMPALEPHLDATVQKFTIKSARGIDGFDSADLQRMPLSLTVGVVSDVQRAFDTVPRWPILRIALHLGLPLDFVVA